MELNENLPIYRAKKINSDEYVEGYLLDNYIIKNVEFDLIPDIAGDNNYCILEDKLEEIDTTTLAVHYPHMIAVDSNRKLSNGEKDLRIFASIREDGKGGDVLKHTNWVGKDRPSNLMYISSIKSQLTLNMINGDIQSNTFESLIDSGFTGIHIDDKYIEPIESLGEISH